MNEILEQLYIELGWAVAKGDTEAIERLKKRVEECKAKTQTN